MVRQVFYFVVTGCLLLSASRAEASILGDLLFGGEDNFVSDNSGEFVIDKGLLTPLDPTDDTPAILDPGDIIVTGFDINTVEGLTSGGLTSVGGSSGNPELGGMSIIKVLTKSAPTGVGPLGLPTFDFTFGPAVADPLVAIALGGGSAGELAVLAEYAGWAPGTMISVHGDTTPNFTRLGAPDDGAPDLGVGPFASEAALLATALDGPLQIQYGMPGLIPPFGTNIFWVADDALDFFGAFAFLPAAAAGGDFDLGLDITANPSGKLFSPVASFNPLTGALGTAMISGSGELKGLGSAGTPYDAFDNVDLVVHCVIPEPGTFLVWLGLVVCGATALWRRLS